MSITGTPLLWVLGVLAVGLPVLTVLAWSRLRGRRSVVVPARWVMVVASQLAAVLLVGAALNDYGYFFGSWSDLGSSVAQSLGQRPTVTPVTYRHGATVAPVRAAGVTGLPTRLTGQTRARAAAKGGRLEHVHIQGASTQLGERGYVYLPPQYFQARYAHTRFPAVEVLGGYPSTNSVLVRRLAIQRLLAHAIAHHHARPMVLVMLRPIVTYPRDTECTNVPAGPQAETYYGQDVPAAISHAFRVRAAGWGVAGISTGGYCATKLTLTYPATFRAAVSMSGYYHSLQDHTTGNLWGGSSVLRNLNSPEWLMAHQPAPHVSLLLTSSRDEAGPYGYADTRRFLRLIHPPTQVSTIIAAHGAHTFTTWAPNIPEALHWLSQQLGPGGGQAAGPGPVAVSTNVRAPSSRSRQPRTLAGGLPPAASVRSAGAPGHRGGHRPRRGAG